jgi:hypothetical protein
MVLEEELNALVVDQVNCIIDEVWDVMNTRPPGTDSISLYSHEIKISDLEMLSHEADILTFTKDLDILLMKTHRLVGHTYFLEYISGIDDELKIWINQILKNINT